jgi:CDP-glucose 4,6-dehydratase
MSAALRDFYEGRRILVTGHTGFKGSWLTSWLQMMGAEVYGLSLQPDQGPDNLFEQAGVAAKCRSFIGDIRDRQAVAEIFAIARPHTIFHLAARALVQQGYEDPIGTFDVNVIGTAVILETARQDENVQSVVCVTTDKVYRNHEWAWPYRENDQLGGRDPYSASKAAAEMVAYAYHQTLAPTDRAYGLATARGGNVVGGGDWSPYRLTPDIVRAIRRGERLELRYPHAIRPWQHVLELCHAYLTLGERLTRGGLNEAAWNFGPPPETTMTVGQYVDQFLTVWGSPNFQVARGEAAQSEAITLKLDASLARAQLAWRPMLDAVETVGWTADWYQRYVAGASAADLVAEQVARFEALISQEELVADA